MASARSGGRTWLPALVAPVLLLALFLGSWALNRSAFGDDSLPDRPGHASLWRWLLEANNGFWGLTPFATADGGRLLVATCVSALVVLLLGFGGTWATLRGSTPGSAAFTAFAATWLVLAVSSVIGEIIWWLIANRDRLDEPGAGEAQFASLTNGLQYAAKYGWLAALVSTLVWVLVRPPASRTAPPADGELGPPEHYSSARTGYYRARAYEDLREERAASPSPPGADGSAGDQRRAALAAQVEAEAAEEATYVGRRSTGVYAADEEDGKADVDRTADRAPAPRRPSGPYGSHRAPGPDD